MQVSKRVVATDPPVIVMTKKLMAGAKDVKSLAQGWAPVNISHAGPLKSRIRDAYYKILKMKRLHLCMVMHVPVAGPASSGGACVGISISDCGTYVRYCPLATTCAGYGVCSGSTPGGQSQRIWPL
jgi:hypothetical protein